MPRWAASVHTGKRKKKMKTFKEAKKPPEEQAEREKVPAMGKDRYEQHSRGEGEVEEQKCSNPTASIQEGPKGNLSLRMTLPTSWSMHCAGRAPVGGPP